MAHRSRDGFCSSYSHNPEDWEAETQGFTFTDHDAAAHRLGSVMDFIIRVAECELDRKLSDNSAEMGMYYHISEHVYFSEYVKNDYTTLTKKA